VINALVFGVPVVRALLESFGVIFAVAVATRAFTKGWSPTTFFGESKIYSVSMVIAPALVFSVVGLPNNKGVSPHLFGLAADLPAKRKAVVVKKHLGLGEEA
jgi:hypothetical protein